MSDDTPAPENWIEYDPEREAQPVVNDPDARPESASWEFSEVEVDEQSESDRFSRQLLHDFVRPSLGWHFLSDDTKVEISTDNLSPLQKQAYIRNATNAGYKVEEREGTLVTYAKTRKARNEIKSEREKNSDIKIYESANELEGTEEFERAKMIASKLDGKHWLMKIAGRVYYEIPNMPRRVRNNIPLFNAISKKRDQMERYGEYEGEVKIWGRNVKDWFPGFVPENIGEWVDQKANELRQFSGFYFARDFNVKNQYDFFIGEDGKLTYNKNVVDLEGITRKYGLNTRGESSLTALRAFNARNFLQTLHYGIELGSMLGSLATGGLNFLAQRIPSPELGTIVLNSVSHVREFNYSYRIATSLGKFLSSFTREGDLVNSFISGIVLIPVSAASGQFAYTSGFSLMDSLGAKGVSKAFLNWAYRYTVRTGIRIGTTQMLLHVMSRTLPDFDRKLASERTSHMSSIGASFGMLIQTSLERSLGKVPNTYNTVTDYPDVKDIKTNALEELAGFSNNPQVNSMVEQLGLGSINDLSNRLTASGFDGFFVDEDKNLRFYLESNGNNPLIVDPEEVFINPETGLIDVKLKFHVSVEDDINLSDENKAKVDNLANLELAKLGNINEAGDVNITANISTSDDFDNPGATKILIVKDLPKVDDLEINTNRIGQSTYGLTVVENGKVTVYIREAALTELDSNKLHALFEEEARHAAGMLGEMEEGVDSFIKGLETTTDTDRKINVQDAENFQTTADDATPDTSQTTEVNASSIRLEFDDLDGNTNSIFSINDPSELDQWDDFGERKFFSEKIKVLANLKDIESWRILAKAIGKDIDDLTPKDIVDIATTLAHWQYRVDYFGEDSGDLRKLLNGEDITYEGAFLNAFKKFSPESKEYGGFFDENGNSYYSSRYEKTSALDNVIQVAGTPTQVLIPVSNGSADESFDLITPSSIINLSGMKSKPIFIDTNGRIYYDQYTDKSYLRYKGSTYEILDPDNKIGFDDSAYGGDGIFTIVEDNVVAPATPEESIVAGDAQDIDATDSNTNDANDQQNQLDVNAADNSNVDDQNFDQAGNDVNAQTTPTPISDVQVDTDQPAVAATNTATPVPNDDSDQSDTGANATATATPVVSPGNVSFSVGDGGETYQFVESSLADYGISPDNYRTITQNVNDGITQYPFQFSPLSSEEESGVLINGREINVKSIWLNATRDDATQPFTIQGLDAVEFSEDNLGEVTIGSETYEDVTKIQFEENTDSKLVLTEIFQKDNAAPITTDDFGESIKIEEIVVNNELQEVSVGSDDDSIIITKEYGAKIPGNSIVNRIFDRLPDYGILSIDSNEEDNELSLKLNNIRIKEISNVEFRFDKVNKTSSSIVSIVFKENQHINITLEDGTSHYGVQKIVFGEDNKVTGIQVYGGEERAFTLDTSTNITGYESINFESLGIADGEIAQVDSGDVTFESLFVNSFPVKTEGIVQKLGFTDSSTLLDYNYSLRSGALLISRSEENPLIIKINDSIQALEAANVYFDIETDAQGFRSVTGYESITFPLENSATVKIGEETFSNVGKIQFATDGSGRITQILNRDASQVIKDFAGEEININNIESITQTNVPEVTAESTEEVLGSTATPAASTATDETATTPTVLPTDDTVTGTATPTTPPVQVAAGSLQNSDQEIINYAGGTYTPYLIQNQEGTTINVVREGIVLKQINVTDEEGYHMGDVVGIVIGDQGRIALYEGEGDQRELVFRTTEGERLGTIAQSGRGTVKISFESEDIEGLNLGQLNINDNLETDIQNILISNIAEINLSTSQVQEGRLDSIVLRDNQSSSSFLDLENVNGIEYIYLSESGEILSIQGEVAATLNNIGQISNVVAFSKGASGEYYFYNGIEPGKENATIDLRQSNLAIKSIPYIHSLFLTAEGDIIQTRFSADNISFEYVNDQGSLTQFNNIEVGASGATLIKSQDNENWILRIENGTDGTTPVEYTLENLQGIKSIDGVDPFAEIREEEVESTATAAVPTGLPTADPTNIAADMTEQAATETTIEPQATTTATTPSPQSTLTPDEVAEYTRLGIDEETNYVKEDSSFYKIMKIGEELGLVDSQLRDNQLTFREAMGLDGLSVTGDIAGEYNLELSNYIGEDGKINYDALLQGIIVEQERLGINGETNYVEEDSSFYKVMKIGEELGLVDSQLRDNQLTFREAMGLDGLSVTGDIAGEYNLELSNYRGEDGKINYDDLLAAIETERGDTVTAATPVEPEVTPASTTPSPQVAATQTNSTSSVTGALNGGQAVNMYGEFVRSYNVDNPAGQNLWVIEKDGNVYTTNGDGDDLNSEQWRSDNLVGIKIKGTEVMAFKNGEGDGFGLYDGTQQIADVEASGASIAIRNISDQTDLSKILNILGREPIGDDQQYILTKPISEIFLYETKDLSIVFKENVSIPFTDIKNSKAITDIVSLSGQDINENFEISANYLRLDGENNLIGIREWEDPAQNISVSFDINNRTYTLPFNNVANITHFLFDESDYLRFDDPIEVNFSGTNIEGVIQVYEYDDRYQIETTSPPRTINEFAISASSEKRQYRFTFAKVGERLSQIRIQEGEYIEIRSPQNSELGTDSIKIRTINFDSDGNVDAVYTENRVKIEINDDEKLEFTENSPIQYAAQGDASTAVPSTDEPDASATVDPQTTPTTQPTVAAATPTPTQLPLSSETGYVKLEDQIFKYNDVNYDKYAIRNINDSDGPNIIVFEKDGVFYRLPSNLSDDIENPAWQEAMAVAVKVDAADEGFILAYKDNDSSNYNIYSENDTLIATLETSQSEDTIPDVAEEVRKYVFLGARNDDVFLLQKLGIAIDNPQLTSNINTLEIGSNGEFNISYEAEVGIGLDSMPEDNALLNRIERRGITIKAKKIGFNTVGEIISISQINSSEEINSNVIGIKFGGVENNNDEIISVNDIESIQILKADDDNDYLEIVLKNIINISEEDESLIKGIQGIAGINIYETTNLLTIKNTPIQINGYSFFANRDNQDLEYMLEVSQKGEITSIRGLEDDDINIQFNGQTYKVNAIHFEEGRIKSFDYEVQGQTRDSRKNIRDNDVWEFEENSPVQQLAQDEEVPVSPTSTDEPVLTETPTADVSPEDADNVATVIPTDAQTTSATVQATVVTATASPQATTLPPETTAEYERLGIDPETNAVSKDSDFYKVINFLNKGGIIQTGLGEFSQTSEGGSEISIAEAKNLDEWVIPSHGEVQRVLGLVGMTQAEIAELSTESGQFDYPRLVEAINDRLVSLGFDINNDTLSEDLSLITMDTNSDFYKVLKILSEREIVQGGLRELDDGQIDLKEVLYLNSWMVTTNTQVKSTLKALGIDLDQNNELILDNGRLDYSKLLVKINENLSRLELDQNKPFESDESHTILVNNQNVKTEFVIQDGSQVEVYRFDDKIYTYASGWNEVTIYDNIPVYGLRVGNTSQYAIANDESGVIVYQLRDTDGTVIGTYDRDFVKLELRDGIEGTLSDLSSLNEQLRSNLQTEENLDYLNLDKINNSDVQALTLHNQVISIQFKEDVSLTQEQINSIIPENTTIRFDSGDAITVNPASMALIYNDDSPQAAEKFITQISFRNSNLAGVIFGPESNSLRIPPQSFYGIRVNNNEYIINLRDDYFYEEREISDVRITTNQDGTVSYAVKLKDGEWQDISFNETTEGGSPSTPTPDPTNTGVPSPTTVPTDNPTATETNTLTPVSTNTAVPTLTPTPTESVTNTAAVEPTQTATNTILPNATEAAESNVSNTIPITVAANAFVNTDFTDQAQEANLDLGSINTLFEGTYSIDEGSFSIKPILRDGVVIDQLVLNSNNNGLLTLSVTMPDASFPTDFYLDEVRLDFEKDENGVIRATRIKELIFPEEDYPVVPDAEDFKDVTYMILQDNGLSTAYDNDGNTPLKESQRNLFRENPNRVEQARLEDLLDTKNIGQLVPSEDPELNINGISYPVYELNTGKSIIRVIEENGDIFEVSETTDINNLQKIGVTVGINKNVAFIDGEDIVLRDFEGNILGRIEEDPEGRGTRIDIEGDNLFRIVNVLNIKIMVGLRVRSITLNEGGDSPFTYVPAINISDQFEDKVSTPNPLENSSLTFSLDGVSQEIPQDLTQEIIPESLRSNPIISNINLESGSRLFKYTSNEDPSNYTSAIGFNEPVELDAELLNNDASPTFSGSLSYKSITFTENGESGSYSLSDLSQSEGSSLEITNGNVTNRISIDNIMSVSYHTSGIVKVSLIGSNQVFNILNSNGENITYNNIDYILIAQDGSYSLFFKDVAEQKIIEIPGRGTYKIPGIGDLRFNPDGTLNQFRLEGQNFEISGNGGPITGSEKTIYTIDVVEEDRSTSLELITSIRNPDTGAISRGGTKYSNIRVNSINGESIDNYEFREEFQGDESSNEPPVTPSPEPTVDQADENNNEADNSTTPTPVGVTNQNTQSALEVPPEVLERKEVEFSQTFYSPLQTERLKDLGFETGTKPDEVLTSGPFYDLVQKIRFFNATGINQELDFENITAEDAYQLENTLRQNLDILGIPEDRLSSFFDESGRFDYERLNEYYINKLISLGFPENVQADLDMSINSGSFFDVMKRLQSMGIIEGELVDDLISAKEALNLRRLGVYIYEREPEVFEYFQISEEDREDLLTEDGDVDFSKLDSYLDKREQPTPTNTATLINTPTVDPTDEDISPTATLLPPTLEAPDQSENLELQPSLTPIGNESEVTDFEQDYVDKFGLDSSQPLESQNIDKESSFYKVMNYLAQERIILRDYDSDMTYQTAIDLDQNPEIATWLESHLGIDIADFKDTEDNLDYEKLSELIESRENTTEEIQPSTSLNTENQTISPAELVDPVLNSEVLPEQIQSTPVELTQTPSIPATEVSDLSNVEINSDENIEKLRNLLGEELNVNQAYIYSTKLDEGSSPSIIISRLPDGENLIINNSSISENPLEVKEIHLEYETDENGNMSLSHIKKIIFPDDKPIIIDNNSRPGELLVQALNINQLEAQNNENSGVIEVRLNQGGNIEEYIMKNNSRQNILPIANENSFDDLFSGSSSESISLARHLNFLEQNVFEDPSNMCGPLSGEILKRMNLLSRSTKLSDLWLATPSKLENVLEGFRVEVIEKPLAEISIEEMNLKAGDVLYLEGGHYDHILVITEVVKSNSDMSIYTITNIMENGEFIIGKRLLYDSNTNSGLLTNEYINANSEQGTTGLRKTHIYRSPDLLNANMQTEYPIVQGLYNQEEVDQSYILSHFNRNTTNRNVFMYKENLGSDKEIAKQTISALRSLNLEAIVDQESYSIRLSNEVAPTPPNFRYIFQNYPSIDIASEHFNPSLSIYFSNLEDGNYEKLQEWNPDILDLKAEGIDDGNFQVLRLEPEDLKNLVNDFIQDTGIDIYSNPNLENLIILNGFYIGKEMSDLGITSILGPNIDSQLPTPNGSFRIISNDDNVNADVAIAYTKGLRAGGLDTVYLKHFGLVNENSIPEGIVVDTHHEILKGKITDSELEKFTRVVKEGNANGVLLSHTVLVTNEVSGTTKELWDKALFLDENGVPIIENVPISLNPYAIAALREVLGDDVKFISDEASIFGFSNFVKGDDGKTDFIKIQVLSDVADNDQILYGTAVGAETGREVEQFVNSVYNYLSSREFVNLPVLTTDERAELFIRLYKNELDYRDYRNWDIADQKLLAAALLGNNYIQDEIQIVDFSSNEINNNIESYIENDDIVTQRLNYLQVISRLDTNIYKEQVLINGVLEYSQIITLLNLRNDHFQMPDNVDDVEKWIRDFCTLNEIDIDRYYAAVRDIYSIIILQDQNIQNMFATTLADNSINKITQSLIMSPFTSNINEVDYSNLFANAYITDYQAKLLIDSSKLPTNLLDNEHARFYSYIYKSSMIEPFVIGTDLSSDNIIRELLSTSTETNDIADILRTMHTTLNSDAIVMQNNSLGISIKDNAEQTLNQFRTTHTLGPYEQFFQLAESEIGVRAELLASTSFFESVWQTDINGEGVAFGLFQNLSNLDPNGYLSPELLKIPEFSIAYNAVKIKSIIDSYKGNEFYALWSMYGGNLASDIINTALAKGWWDIEFDPTGYSGLISSEQNDFMSIFSNQDMMRQEVVSNLTTWQDRLMKYYPSDFSSKDEITVDRIMYYIEQKMNSGKNQILKIAVANEMSKTSG